MVKDYEIIEHTADVGLKVIGNTKQKLFQNAARGMFFLITGSHIYQNKMRNIKAYHVQCQALNFEDLLVSWLSELLYQHSTEFVIFCDYHFLCFRDQFIESEIRGAKIEDSPYRIEMEIKAITYYNLEILKNKNGLWEAKILFDI